MPPKVAVIGSGNWGTTVARIVAGNVVASPELAEFEREVPMYTFEETLDDGRRLTEVINRYHQNVKYLPGVILPDNVRAVADPAEAAAGATVLLLTSPHQFLPEILAQIATAVTPEQRPHLCAVNLAKGLHFDEARGVLLRMSELAGELLELPATRLAALSGPNVAPEIAAGHPAEASLAAQSPVLRQQLAALFRTPSFAIRPSADVVGVEMGGALKNIVAIAAGLVDGFEMGYNTKATVIRLGMEEMYRFACLPELGNPPQRATFDGPAFLGDVLTTCYGGRNRRYGEEVGRDFKQGRKPMPVEDFERVVLRGQKVQGYRTTQECMHFLERLGKETDFPLFATVRNAIEHATDPRESLQEILHAS